MYHTPKRYNPGDKVFFGIFKDNKSFWEMGTIENRVGKIIYIIKGKQFTHKRHLNQLTKRLMNEADIYDPFDIPTPLGAPDMHRSKRKRKATDLIVVNPKRIRY